MRLALARALFVPCSDLILLDECTNHLDLHGLQWLIRYIQGSDHTLMVVSHDRSFLDAVCTDIVVMEHQRLTYHVGSYSHYQQQVQEKAAREAQILDAADRQRSKAVAFVQKHQQSSMANKKNADPNKQRQAKMIKEKKMDRIGNYRE
jgi:ATP-binding cassette, subfamily F, member 3